VLNEIKVIEVINKLDFGFNLDPKNTSLDAPLKSFGIDSLDIYNIFIELESETGRTVLDTDVADLTTIKKLAEYFYD
jgi:acyl carrier protein